MRFMSDLFMVLVLFGLLWRVLEGFDKPAEVSTSRYTESMRILSTA